MRQRLLPGIIIFLCVLVGGASFAKTEPARVRVALLDGELVYHWAHFQSVVRDDVDRALILRAFRRGGYTLPEHYIDEELNEFVKVEFKGDHGKMLEDLKRLHATLEDFRTFTAEELKIQAMRKYVTVHGKYGETPIPEKQWLASLRKEARINMIK